MPTAPHAAPGPGKPAVAALAVVMLLVMPLVMLLAAAPALAQDTSPGATQNAAAKAAAVTVLRAAKACFAANVDITGVLIPRNEVPVGAPGDGLKVADALVDPGDVVTAGQALARLTAPTGAALTVEAPVAGMISAATALIGMTVSRLSEPLFKIIADGEFDMAAQASAAEMRRLEPGQTATIRVAGAGEVSGKVRQVATSIEPNTQLGRVFITIDATRRLLANAAARATIKTGESCGIGIPLTAVLYGDAGTVVQVVRHDRVETHRVETGLMAGGQVEIREGLSEGDVVVARAGSLLREGDRVRPIAAKTGAADEPGSAAK